MYLAKTKSSEKEEWHTTFDGKAFNVGHAVRLNANIGYTIVGYNGSVKPNGKGDA
jgi:hypothetical protein